jgi:hypothetical protein
MSRVGWLVVLLWAVPAWAGHEAQDLKRQIDAQRAAAVDFERLDSDHAVTDEITLYRAWLDEATAQLNKDQLNRVREVLDRLVAQAELVRQRIAATKVTAQVREREGALRALREKNDRTQKQTQELTVTKKALEMNAK